MLLFGRHLWISINMWPLKRMLIGKQRTHTTQESCFPGYSATSQAHWTSTCVLHRSSPFSTTPRPPPTAAWGPTPVRRARGEECLVWDKNFGLRNTLTNVTHCHILGSHTLWDRQDRQYYLQHMKVKTHVHVTSPKVAARGLRKVPAGQALLPHSCTDG